MLSTRLWRRQHVFMISQRYKSGTISTPEGGAVVNGALLDSDNAFNHGNGNNDEQDV